jgi:hypothetical protein
MIRRATSWAILAGVLLPGAARASDAAHDQGWQEAVVSVSNFDAHLRVFRDVIGWQVMHRGRVAPGQLAAWGISGDAIVDEIVLGQRGAVRGFIRLVRFPGHRDRERIRSSAQPWEAGGWSGVNVRVRDIDTVFRRLQQAGFQAYSDPVEFRVPPYRVREAMMMGPDGLVLGLLERVDPPFRDFEWTSLVSRPVTAFTVVRDLDAVGDTLERIGLQTRLSYDGAAAEPGPNLFGLPHDLVGNVTRHVRWWRLGDGDEGMIAAMSFEGLAGRSHVEAAVPPSLGLFALRVPVRDVASACGRVVGALQPATPLAPYGVVRICTVRLENGARLELFARESAARQ